jgi:hypothetical protein
MLYPSNLPRSKELSEHLLGGFNHLEKYESQWEGLYHILWNNKKCSKPPTKHQLHMFFMAGMNQT